jgi:hypothetical protein
MADFHYTNLESAPAWVSRAREVGDTSSHARLDPEDEGRYLRCLTIGGVALDKGMTPQAYLELAEHHFSVLESSGLSVPHREYYIEATEEFAYPLGIRLYSSVARIDGQRLSEVPEPQRHALASDLFNSLRSYYDWAKSRDQRLALTDISYLRQYHWGKTENDENKKLYLHDIDPHLFSLTNKRDQELWEIERREFRLLAKYVDILLVDSPLE